MLMTLRELQPLYQAAIREKADPRGLLTPDGLAALSLRLYGQCKVSGASDSGEPLDDMLLFQYGISDRYDGRGPLFRFDITRQLCVPGEDEPYQLSLTLLYAPEPFRGIEAFHLWSSESEPLEGFFEKIQQTEGFQAALGQRPSALALDFSRV